jgi:hypothetical protein
MKKLVVDGHEAKIAVVKISFSTPLALLCFSWDAQKHKLSAFSETS